MRAYDLARAGEVMDLAPRPLWVDRLAMTGQPDADHAEFEMVCGKGGYVRSIARDLGQALGTLGHVLWLRREWSGPFRASQGIDLATIERLARTEALDAYLLPLELALEGLPRVEATAEGAARLRNGTPGMVLGPVLDWGTEAWAAFDNRALAVGIWQAGVLHPGRVFAGA